MSSDERLYYTDAYLTEFQAAVAEVDTERTRVRLGHTAFYPTSGGQLNDLGTIAGIRVIDVVDTPGGVLHVLDAPLNFQTGAEVESRIEWHRRFDHMQQHTGQHLLSAVFADVAGADTLSFHMGSDLSTIDLSCPVLPDDVLDEVERQANRIVTENRPVDVSFEEASSASGLRKATERTGILRIVTIDKLDRSACGGTHVRRTGEIGSILLRGSEKVRGSLRVEFVCGARAVRAARADYKVLSRTARQLGCSLHGVQRTVGTQTERLAAAEKHSARIAAELANLRGRNLASGTTLHVSEHSALTEEVRSEAQGFIQGGGQAYVGWCKQPASVLLACAESANLHAGNLLKPLLTEAGGRGGGSAQTAQGSVPDTDRLQQVIARLQDCLSSAIVAPAPPSAGVAG